MITHIETANDGKTGRPSSPPEPSTAEETNIDDLFESFAHEIACDLSVKERAPEIFDTVLADNWSSKIDLGIQINDQINRTLQVKQTVPYGIAESEEQRLNQIAAREQGAFTNLRLPGKNRDSMPSISNQSKR